MTSVSFSGSTGLTMYESNPARSALSTSAGAPSPVSATRYTPVATGLAADDPADLVAVDVGKPDVDERDFGWVLGRYFL